MPGIKKITRNKKTAIIGSLLFLAVLFFIIADYADIARMTRIIPVVFAQETNVAGLGPEFAAQAGFATTDIRITIARIIRAILGFLGILAVLIILYGGFIYMTSGGNEEKIAKAKRIIRDAIIGLIIVLSSFAITQFIISRLLGAAGLGGEGGVGGPGGSALGAGPIESHYPGRNATGIPRNTNIIITFKEKITVEDIINNQGTPETTDDILTDKIKICKLPCGEGDYLASSDVRASVTEDQRTFVFDPLPLLGSAEESMWYKVSVDGSIRKATGKTLFFGIYDWQFEVSTFVDITPPMVVSVIPYPASENPRNTVIQINFNEGINPITASGKVEVDAQGQITSAFKNITVEYLEGGTRKAIAGNFTISNQYRTVEFLADEPCRDKQGNIMKNSCGGDVFCLPGDKDFIVTVRAATLGSEPPAAIIPSDGIVDLANNSFDGNRSGKAEGPQSQSGHSPYDLSKVGKPINQGCEDNDPATPCNFGDDLIWPFKTNDTIDLTPPEIKEVIPEVGAGMKEGLSPFNPLRPIRILFSKLIMSSTLKPDSNYTYIDKDGQEKSDPFEYVTLIQPEPPADFTGNPSDWKALNWVGYWLGKEDGDFDNNGEPESIGVIYHGQFLEFSDYNVRVGSGVKDIHQNCFFPSPGPACPEGWGPQAPSSGYPSCEAVVK